MQYRKKMTNVIIDLISDSRLKQTLLMQKITINIFFMGGGSQSRYETKFW